MFARFCWQHSYRALQRPRLCWQHSDKSADARTIASISQPSSRNLLSAAGSEAEADAWAAVTRVWASKWNARAFSALGVAGAAPADLQMAVLAQGVLPAEYAWVAHTTNPVTGVNSWFLATRG